MIKKIGIGAIILVIFVWLCISFYLAHKPKDEFIQGSIEANQYSIASKVAGRIGEIFVQKGDFINQGDLAYVIDSPELNAKIEQAKAGYEAAKALRKEGDKGSREETIKSAKDVYLAQKSVADLAKITYERVQNLYDSGVVSLQKRDEAEANYKRAKYSESTALEQYKIALDGATNETKEALKQKELAALGTLNEVESYAKDVQAFSPISGEVSNVLIHKNELSPSGFPVVLVLDVKNLYLKFSVKESELARFKMDSTFSGFIPALDSNADFVVKYIAPLGEFSAWKGDKNYTQKSFEIHAHLISEIPDLRVGMSVLIK